MRSIQKEVFSAGVSASDGASSGAGLTLSQAAGFFNVVAGFMLVAAVLLFVGGFIGWVTRLGLTGRDEGIYYMVYGVYVLTALIVVLAIIHFVQFHTQVVLTLLAVAVIILIGWFAIQIAKSAGTEEEKR